MKFSSEITINRPRQQVVALITDSGNTAKWQPGVKSIELLSGEKDQLGARSRVMFEFNGLQLEVIETVIERSPPERFASSFETRGVRNTVVNRFYETAPGQTRWIMDNAFDFNRAMSVVAFLIRSVISKQTAQSMKQFKAFAESN
ncbi:MAG: SRPBCC family protein [Anaerolineae bacterium]|nr:SRPBCC family protein [Anaerolineae bacterium]